MTKRSSLSEQIRLQMEDSEEGGRTHQGAVRDEAVVAMLTAAGRGDAERLRQLLDDTPDLDIMATNQRGETALHLAAAAGSVESIKLLHDKGFRLDLCDKHGDSPLHWASRHGHLDVVAYLHENGANVNIQNNSDETPIHLAIRLCHTSVIEYLCTVGADVNLHDNEGDSSLHMAAWHGLPGPLCALLCQRGAMVDARNKDGETALHLAASRGNVECVEVLLEYKASINLVDKRLSTPLHIACKKSQATVAAILLESSCALDVLDQNGESALHSAAKEGMSSVVQNMCAYGCQVDVVSKAGLTPLHFAARSGHIDVVRCLLLSGAEPATVNKDELTAEMMAMANGHIDIADLLNKAKFSIRNNCVNQLMPSDSSMKRIKVKVFGSSGVGKSTLIESLKSSYISSFFRRSWFGSSTDSSKPSSPTKNGCESQDVELGVAPAEASCNVRHTAYTKGIDVQQISITSAGELSVWEFSGFEPYYVVYDHYIGDPNCINVIVFSLADTTEQQLAQVEFWMDFIRLRMPSSGPILHAGLPAWSPVILFIATHADVAKCVKNSRGEYVCKEAEEVLSAVRRKFHSNFSLSNKIFICDSNQAASVEMKALRLHLAELKAKMVLNLPRSTGFFDATLAVLPDWQQSLGLYPVVSWPSFVEYIRAKVNLLASEEHIQEMMCQLQLSGEIIYLEAYDNKDLIVLQPQWLCSDMIGYLLSHDQQARARATGVYTVDDFQRLMVEGDAALILKVLEELQLGVQCNDNGEEPAYEFPCLNSLSRLPGIWEQKVPAEAWTYGGVRLVCPVNERSAAQLIHIFPRIQVQLRHNYLHLRANRSTFDCSLLQWHWGSKFCHGKMECLITFEQGHGQPVVDIVLRGPVGQERHLYAFLENVFECVTGVLEDVCPGFRVERHVLSVADLKSHADNIRSYSPRDVLYARLLDQGEVRAADDSTAERLVDLLFFGNDALISLLTFGTELHTSHLPAFTRRQLSALLDVPDPMGRDWCLLAVLLGLSNVLPNLDRSTRGSFSKTDHILYMWSSNASASIRQLIAKLEELQRQDAVDVVLYGIPICVVKSSLRISSAAKLNRVAAKYNAGYGKGNRL